MGSRAVRPIALMVIALAVTVGLSAPLTPNNSAGAAGSAYDVGNWTDPSGQGPPDPLEPLSVRRHLRRQPPKGRLAQRPPGTAAVADVQAAFRRVSKRTGIPFSFSGRTAEIPRNAGEAVVGDASEGRGGGGGMGGPVTPEVPLQPVDRRWVRLRVRRRRLDDAGVDDSDGKWQAAIGRGFVVLNAGHNNIYKPGFGNGVTRGALLLHEIGHAVGLGHVGMTKEIMYPTMLSREHSRYKGGDQAGLKRVGRSLGCIAGASTPGPRSDLSRSPRPTAPTPTAGEPSAMSPSWNRGRENADPHWSLRRARARRGSATSPRCRCRSVGSNVPRRASDRAVASGITASCHEPCSGVVDIHRPGVQADRAGQPGHTDECLEGHADLVTRITRPEPLLEHQLLAVVGPAFRKSRTDQRAAHL